MNIPWLPVRWVIPILIIVTGLISSSIFYAYEIKQSISEYEIQTQKNAFKDTFRSAILTEYLLMQYNMDAVTAELSGLATESEIESLVLIAPSHTVLYASRIAWIGESVEYLDTDLQHFLTSAQHHNRGTSLFSPDHNTLYLYFPLHFQDDNLAAHHEKYGSLVAKYDLALGKQIIRYAVERRLLAFSTLFAVVAFIIGLLSFFALTKRAQRIVNASESFASGDMASRSQLTGYDELAQISRAFDQMAEQIELAMLQTTKLANVVEHMVECVFITDINGTIEYVNPAFTTITGHTASEALGQNAKMLKSGKHNQGFYQSFWHTIRHGQIWRGIMIDQRKDGTPYTAKMSVIPIYHLEKISHFVAVQEDITQQREADKKLHQKSKMESLGTLVGGIAHEFNNILAGMVGNLYLAKTKTKHIAEALQPIEHAEQLSYRAATMIQQLLTFSHQGHVHLMPMDIGAFIQSSMPVLRTSVSKNIALHVNISSAPLMVEADETQIQQIMLNLLTNAQEACQHQAAPAIKVSISAYVATPEFLQQHQTLNRAYVLISVADNGCGIHQRDIQHIFEPFFTTREVGKGTGLGLSTVFAIVQQHHGFVEVESAVNQGTHFRVYLPSTSTQPTDKPNTIAAFPTTADKGKRLLIVDDEAVIRESLRDVLQDAGFDVDTASNGEEAVSIFSNHPTYNLVVLDAVMPVMGGSEAALRIRQIAPDVPIIFYSGYDKQHLSANTNLSLSHSITLRKPVQPEQLLGEIAKLLAKHQGLEH